MDIRLKFDESRSNCSRDIRLLRFVTDERRRTSDPVVLRQTVRDRPCDVIRTYGQAKEWANMRPTTSPLTAKAEVEMYSFQVAAKRLDENVHIARLMRHFLALKSAEVVIP